MRLIDKEQTAKDIGRYKAVALERGNDEMNKMMECYINPTAFSDGVSYGMRLAQEVVCAQPITCDTEAVVRQLEKERKIAFLTLANTGYEINDFAYCCVATSMDKAIEIVRRGGVSNENSIV